MSEANEHRLPTQGAPLTPTLRTSTLFKGIPVRDYPALARIRLTECRRHGHSLGLDDEYCENCGAPWLFWPVDADRKQMERERRG